MMIVDASRQAGKKKLLFLPHAIGQMSRPERMITPQEVERVVLTGELVEDYPHRSSHSCCLFTQGGLSSRDYRLSSPPDQWSPDYRKRR
jgi:hypothetical protein